MSIAPQEVWGGVSSVIHLSSRFFRDRCTDVGVAGGADTCDQQTYRNREQQYQGHLPCTRHIAQDAEEERSTRGEQVTDRLGHTRERSGVLGVWSTQREEGERQAEGGTLTEA